MIPGLTERECRAHEAIRRAWLDAELAFRIPAIALSEPPDGTRRGASRALLMRVRERLLARTTGRANHRSVRQRGVGVGGARETGPGAAGAAIREPSPPIVKTGARPSARARTERARRSQDRWDARCC